MQYADSLSAGCCRICCVVVKMQFQSSQVRQEEAADNAIELAAGAWQRHQQVPTTAFGDSSAISAAEHVP